MAELETWQIEHNGLLIGDGTDVLIAEIAGLGDIPEIVNSDRALVARHGVQPGADFLGRRAVTLVLELEASNDENLAKLFSDLTAAFSPADEESPFRFKIPGIAGGNVGLLFARCRRRSAPIGLDWLYRLPMVTVELDASDPRIYADTSSLVKTKLPGAGGGAEFDIEFPLTFGEADNSNIVPCPNGGTFPLAPTLRFDGQLTSPKVENLTTGEAFELNITIPNGQFLVADMEAGTIELGGTTSRYSSLAVGSDWLTLRPGENSLRFTSDGGAESGQLTVSYRSAYV